MLHYTPEFLSAEMAYRRERLTAGEPTHRVPRDRSRHHRGSLLDAVLGRYSRRHASPAVGH